MSLVRMPDTAFSLDRTRKGGQVKNAKHLAFIRRLPSVISGAYGVQACHLRMADPRYDKPSTGKGQKPDDCWTLPMTRAEHTLQHSMSERAFWISHGMDDPCGFAQQLFNVTGDQEAAERLIFDHVATLNQEFDHGL